MDVQELHELLNEFLQAIDLLMSSGEEISDEFYGMIAQTLGNIYSSIEELEQSNNQPSAPPAPPISPDAQLLWVLAGQQEQAFISYLRDFPSAETQRLLNNPNLLSKTIEQLTQMMPAGEQPVVDGIQHADLNSSNIWGTAYDPKSGKLKVRFQGGSEYEYDGVPVNIYRAFQKGNAQAKTSGKNQYGQWWKFKSPSLGAAMNQYIKAGNFPYRKLN